MVLLSNFLKNGHNISLVPVTRQSFPWLPWLFKCHGEWFGNYINWFPQNSGMHLVRSHRLMCMFRFLRWSWTWLSYSGRDFAPPVPALQSIHLRGVGREDGSEDWGKNVVEYLVFLLVRFYQFASLAYQEWYSFFDLPFLADIPNISLCSPSVFLRSLFPFHKYT